MWTWNCSACPEVFTGAEREETEARFLSHAREKHNPKLLVSFTDRED